MCARKYIELNGLWLNAARMVSRIKGRDMEEVGNGNGGV